MTGNHSVTDLVAAAEFRGRLSALVRPVTPIDVPLFDAIGATLAADLIAPAAVPAQTVALFPGHAVASVETIGASPYAPAMPSDLAVVAAGAPLPAGLDAVLPAGAVSTSFGFATVQQAVAPGEGVRRVGEDFAPGARLVAAGRRWSAAAAHCAAAIGVDRIAVRRPRVAIGHDDNRAGRTAAAALAAALDDGRAMPLRGSLDEAASHSADLIVLIGGPAIDAADPAVATLAAHGRPDGAGVALRPIESLAWGEIADRPVVIVPNRPEAVFAALVAVVGPLVGALAGALPHPWRETRPLARKIVSQVGMSEIALLAESDDGVSWLPLATGDLTWSALTRAVAWIELPPESEGLAETTLVAAERL